MKLVVIWHAGGAYPERISPFTEYSDAEVTLIVPEQWSKGLVKTIVATASQQGRFKVRPEKTWWDIKEALHIYPDIDRVLSEEAPDAIYILEEYYSLVTFQVLRWRNQNCPEVPLVFRTSQSLRKNYPPPFCWLESYVLSRSNGAVCVNHEAAEILRQKGFVKPIEIVADGVDVEVFRPNQGGQELKNEISPDRPLIGYVGRLAQEKGIDTLIRATARLSIPATLLLIGDGPEKEHYRELAERLDISEQVVFNLPMPRNDLPRWMDAMDVFVLPSLTCPHWKEKFGMVVIEAMSCETAIVGSDSGEIPHLIDDAGLVFHEGDVDDLTDSLNLLLNDEAKRLELSKKGRQRVLENYTMEINVTSILDFFRKV